MAVVEKGTSTVRSCWIGTSWKMNKTLAEALDFTKTLAAFLPSLDAHIQPFLIPPFTCVREAKRALSDTGVLVGAQNMHWFDSGAWTGEISPLMLKDCGLDLVEIGHSERREHFGETDETVGLKTAAAVRHGLVPLVCVGESLVEREASRTNEVLSSQVKGALQFLGADALSAQIVFAYEPVWAIGEKGIPASSDYADMQHALIKDVATNFLPAVPKVLYGGSVTASNCAEFASQPNIDGLFIGRSALEAESYISILQLVTNALKIKEEEK